MLIKILGTGGFENVGLPFNSFLVDGHILVETPPDILQSLHREAVDLDGIDTIILTHYHGDHYFGLPFLLFNILARREKSENIVRKRLRLIGPSGLEAKARGLLALAISPDHSYLAWFDREVERIEISESSLVDLGNDTWVRFSSTVHLVPTFSASFGKGAPDTTPRFVATSDTRWDARLKPLFASGAPLILCDANGKEDGGVHMSISELIGKALPLLKPGSILIGTHVSEDIADTEKRLRIARSGDVFEV
jgi:ribonuclease BN (tRNA processing enzyme)